MRIMLDTNILFSAILFPNGTTAKALNLCIEKHEIVICSYVIDEIKRIVKKKFPNKIKAINDFLDHLDFDYVYTPSSIPNNIIDIRDEKDYPIIYTAIVENVDAILSGDKDFKATGIDHPIILTPSDFLNGDY